MGTPEAATTTKSGHVSEDTDPPATLTSEPDTDHYPLPEDELFHVLQNERRRAVLRYLNGTEGAVEMRAIAEQVAAWEHDTTVDQLDSDQRQRVYIALYQSHLETMADAGIVDYEKSRGKVELTDAGQEVASYMEGVDDGNDAPFGWQDYSLDYLAATAASSLLIGGSTTGILGLARLSSFTVSVLTVVLFTAVTVGRIGAKFA
ncbi:hypothetical protein ACKVMT_07240 [Halobacteriales archaeon Cl-PHB]